MNKEFAQQLFIGKFIENLRPLLEISISLQILLEGMT